MVEGIWEIMMINYNIDDYYDGSDKRPEGSFRISPSGVSRFFSEKTQWYREELLGEDKKFTGSSATLLGEICHFAAEKVAECKIHKVPYASDKLHQAINAHIAKYTSNDEYDTDMVEANWKNMAEILVKDFVLESNTCVTEKYIQHELLPGVYVAGTMDAITSSSPTDVTDGTIESLKKAVGVLTVRDFKTSSKLPSSFTYAYKLQAYSYCYMLRKMGINITSTELCFAVRPTKTLPVRSKKFVIPFDDQAYNFIEGILKLIAESVQTFKDWPDMQYLLACDFRLKKNEIPRPA